MARDIPVVAAKLCYGFGGWVVGGAVTSEHPKDWDIAIPFENWSGAAMLIPGDSTPNAFGGWSFCSEGVEYDVFPCSLSWLMQNRKCTVLWNPKTGDVFRRCDDR